MWLIEMCVTNFTAVIVCICIAIRNGRADWQRCDRSKTSIVPEGNFGQSEVFNWVGVLRVNLHDRNNEQIAVTGLVLITDKYTLANADDVARIPKKVFKESSKAMFIPHSNSPWFCKTQEYYTHPEYEYSTFNTIAVVELDLDGVDSYPLTPVCLPAHSYNTASKLFAVGFTDENRLLEKVIYRIQYLTQPDCEQFYQRAGLSDGFQAPTHYLCGFASYNKTQCVWENGMLLVSNATGRFNLIGFGIRGPGCGAPARFLDIQYYLPWIKSTVAQENEMYDSVDMRRYYDDNVKYLDPSS